MPLFEKQQFSQSDMDLIDILCFQDVDMGVVRDDFIGLQTSDDLYTNKSATYMFENSGDIGKPAHEDNFQFPVTDQYVDRETGELVLLSLIPSDTDVQQISEPMLQQQSSGSILDDLLSDKVQISNVEYKHQSSLDERLLDVYDVLGLSTPTEEPVINAVFGLPSDASLMYVTKTPTSGVINDFQQYDDGSDVAGQCVDVLTDELESYYGYAVSSNVNAAQSIYANTNDLHESYQCMNSPVDANGDASLVFPMLTPPPFGNVFDLDTVLTQPSSDVSNFFSATGLDSDSMTLFLQTDSPPALTDVPNFAYEQVNMSMSNTAFPFTYESHMANEVGGLITHIGQNYSAGFSEASVCEFDGLQAMVEQTVKSSATQPSTDTLLRQMLQSDLVEDFELTDIAAGNNVVEADCYDSVGDDGSNGSAIFSTDPLTGQVNNIQDLARPLMETQEWFNVNVPKFDTYQGRSVADEYDIFDEVSTMTPELNYVQNRNSPSSWAKAEPSPLSALVDNNMHSVPQRSGRKGKGRTVIKEEVEETDSKQSRSRDEKRAKAMKIPLSVDQIIDTSVEEFTEMLNRHQLTDAQQQLVRDIRRRGKNKMAAQNCRKRKMEVIGTLDEQVTALRDQRDILHRERADLDKKFATLQDRFQQLETKLFQQVRDKSGRLYDRNHYSLLQTDDGGLFIIPRSGNNATQQQVTLAETSHSEKNGRRRKPKEMNLSA